MHADPERGHPVQVRQLHGKKQGHVLAMAGLELDVDVRISRNPECPTEAEFQKSMDEFRKGVIMRQALIDRNKATRKHVPTEDMPSDTPSEQEEAWCPGDGFVCMLERCFGNLQAKDPHQADAQGIHCSRRC